MNEKKQKNNKFRFRWAVLISAALLITDFYILVNNLSYKIPAFAAVTVLFLLAVDFSVDFAQAIWNDFWECQREQYENVIKAQKASYVMMNDIMQSLKRINSLHKENTQQILRTQKASAKVLLAGEKENAQNRMDFERNMTAKLAELEMALQDSEHHGDLESETANEQIFLENQSKILQQLEFLLEKVEEVSNETLQQKTVLHTLEEKLNMSNAVQQTEDDSKEELTDVDDLFLNITAEEQPEMEESEQQETGMDVILEQALASDAEEESEPEEEFADIDAILADLTAEENFENPASVMEEIPISETESVIEEVPVTMQDKVVEEIPISDTESVIEEKIIDEPQEEPISKPDFSDPGKVMTPEEIAALIANL